MLRCEEMRVQVLHVLHAEAGVQVIAHRHPAVCHLLHIGTVDPLRLGKTPMGGELRSEEADHADIRMPLERPECLREDAGVQDPSRPLDIELVLRPACPHHLPVRDGAVLRMHHADLPVEPLRQGALRQFLRQLPHPLHVRPMDEDRNAPVPALHLARSPLFLPCGMFDKLRVVEHRCRRENEPVSRKISSKPAHSRNPYSFVLHEDLALLCPNFFCLRFCPLQSHKGLAIALQLRYHRVPSHVCTQCGAVSYPDAVMEHIEKMIESMKNGITEFSVATYAA